MVSVKVITDQLNENILPTKTENLIRRLLGQRRTITRKQALLLQNIIDDAARELRIDPTIPKLQRWANINITATATAAGYVEQFGNNISKMFNFGIEFTNKTPSNTARLFTETVRQNSMKYVTRMGEDLKGRMGTILQNGLRNELTPYQISENMQRELNITKARADTIARTETMRAANQGSYIQALREGMEYFTVDSRAEACTICRKEYTGRVFQMSESEMLPPLHPSCACLPVYHRYGEDAERDAQARKEFNDRRRDEITSMGHKIPADGTGDISRD